MSRQRSRSPCSSNDPRDLERRIFVGNLPTSEMEKKDLEDMFRPYGKVVGVSLFRGYGFVQFERPEEAEAARDGHKGRIYKGYKIDVNMAVERRNPKAQTQASPPRRLTPHVVESFCNKAPFSSYGDAKGPRPRSRSPVYSRDGREPRDGREGRGSSREARPGRDHDYRYRGSETRDKDRADPRDTLYRDDVSRAYRGGAEEPYRRKEEPFREPYPDEFAGRRETEDELVRFKERRRNDLYRQYYEELQRRCDTDRPVDCSVIVVNKAQKTNCREYAETVGRQVRDLGMVVDLIFLNTEVSLTQALEDVGRARTPFAIIITQQHQMHRSCTVNILFGTPQEHRNMPMQDAMMLVAHNYDAYKVESREKERMEIVGKAAKMADEVLLREPDRDAHPLSVFTSIALLSDNRFLTPEELETLIMYLKDKRARLVGSAVPHAAPIHGGVPPAGHRDVGPSAAGLPASSMSHSSSLSLSTGPSSANSSHQQELQAKILSLFNSGSGPAASPGGVSAGSAQSQGYSSMGPSAPSSMPRPPMKGPPAAGGPRYGAPASRMPAAAPGSRSAAFPSNINLDNPNVKKALDQIISGPSMNHMVGGAGSQQSSQRPAASMNQAPPMSMYPPRHY